MTAPFRSPEHCLTVAFAFAHLRIEPRNATAAVIESIRARAGAHAVEDTRPPSGMSQHEWHAQAVMALSFVERQLSPHPLLWQAVQAEYSHGISGALALQAIADEVAADLDGRERLLADLLIMREFRGTPRLRDLADQFDLSKNTIARRGHAYREPVGRLRQRVLSLISGPMEEVGLVPSAAHA